MAWKANSANTKKKVQVNRNQIREHESHDKNMARTRGGLSVALMSKKSMSANRLSQCSQTSYLKEPCQIGSAGSSPIRTKTSNLQFLLLREPLYNLLWNTQFNTHPWSSRITTFAATIWWILQKQSITKILQNLNSCTIRNFYPESTTIPFLFRGIPPLPAEHTHTHALTKLLFHETTALKGTMLTCYSTKLKARVPCIT